jgi:hypothetical protein
MIHNISVRFLDNRASHLLYSYNGGDKVKVINSINGEVEYISIDKYPEEILKIKDTLKQLLESLIEA